MQPIPEPEDLNPFQFGILVLSIALLVGLAAEFVFRVPREVGRLIFFIDTTICFLLFTDWAYRFIEAKSKAQFMKWGWLDLLACIPAVAVFEQDERRTQRDRRDRRANDFFRFNWGAHGRV